MEEVVRGSQEKVGLAQAVYDSVRNKFRFSQAFDATPVRRSTDTYVSSTNPSANRRCPSPSASDRAPTPPSSRTSPPPRAGPARHASRTARYLASARTRTISRAPRSARAAKSLSAWRREARHRAGPPRPKKARRARRGRRIGPPRRRRRLRGLPRPSRAV